MTTPTFNSTFFSELPIDTEFHFLGGNTLCVKVSSSQFRVDDIEIASCSPLTLVQPSYSIEDIFDDS